jgi:diacylglycerol kinase (ATP)
VAVLRLAVLLIINPASRRGLHLQAVACQAMRDAGVLFDAVLTEQPGHAATLASTLASQYELVLTLGGDGTAMEVIGALISQGPPVGILPGGTGNLLARALGIPLNVRKAIPALLNGTVTHIDLGRLQNGRHFAIGVGVGVDATMIAETSLHWKRRIGITAYVAAAARAVLRQDRFLVQVNADGRCIERHTSMVMVANFGTLLNDLITLGEGIRYDDGILNACLFDPLDFGDAVRIMWKLITRDFTPDPAMDYLSGQHIGIVTDPPRLAQADGDIIGTSPFAVVTAPLAGCIITPHRQINRQ